MDYYMASITGNMSVVQGKKALNAGSYDEAIKCANEVLKMYAEVETKNPEEQELLQENIIIALNLLGLGLYKKGEVDDSFKTFNVSVEKAEFLYENNNKKYSSLLTKTLDNLVACQFESKMFDAAINNLQTCEEIYADLFNNSFGEEKIKHCISYGFTICDMSICFNKGNKHDKSVPLIEDIILFLWPFFLENQDQKMFASLMDKLMQTYGATLKTLFGADWANHANEFFENNNIGISV